jgi:hypothetical protein
MTKWLTLCKTTPCIALIFVLFTTSQGQSANLRPFQSSTEKLLIDIRKARIEGHFDRARQLLAHLETTSTQPLAATIYEKGLLLRDERKTETAITFLRRAADLAPSSNARLDLAAFLVKLDRWPEAVVVLKICFDERSASLPVRAVLTDARFAKLITFEPYQDLLDNVGHEQSGLLGKLKQRLENIEATARNLEHIVARLSQVVEAIAMLAIHPLTAVMVLMLITFVFATGIQQMQLLQSPWTLIAALIVSSLGWTISARILTAGQDIGKTTIFYVTLAILVPIALGHILKAYKSWRAKQPQSTQGPAATHEKPPPQ